MVEMGGDMGESGSGLKGKKGRWSTSSSSSASLASQPSCQFVIATSSRIDESRDCHYGRCLMFRGGSTGGMHLSAQFCPVLYLNEVS
jgi:hypothetical protein